MEEERNSLMVMNKAELSNDNREKFSFALKPAISSQHLQTNGAMIITNQRQEDNKDWPYIKNTVGKFWFNHLLNLEGISPQIQHHFNKEISLENAAHINEGTCVRWDRFEEALVDFAAK